MQAWKSCKKIWTNEWNAITMIGLIKEKCATDEHRWKHCLMVNRSGAKKI